MDVIYLTADQLLALHEAALEGGGLAGGRSQHGLLSVIGQVEQTVFGEDAYPTLAEKAAAYAYFIVAGQGQGQLRGKGTFDGSVARPNVQKYRRLRNMPGWRNWQTHRT